MSHGNLADGIYSSIRLIMGEQENIKVINAFTGSRSTDISAMIDEALAQYNPDDEVIVCTDVYGGSVNSEWMRRLSHEHYYLITNMNLPLLLEMLCVEEPDTQKMIRDIVSEPGIAPKYCNDSCKTIEEEDF